MKKLVLKSLFATVLVAAVLAGCKKEKTEDLDSDTNAAKDNALIEASYNDANDIADEAATNGSLSSFRLDGAESLLSHCATISLDTNAAGDSVITVNFGTTNCYCHDGRFRRGIVMVTFSGAYRDSGHVHTISFNNYYVNDYHIEGSKTVTNMGHNSSGHTYFTIQVNGLVTDPNGNQRTWTSSRQRVWTAGESTLTRFDDEYLITGSASGTSFAGRAFSITITSALLRKVSCHQFVSGTLELAIQGKPTRYVDYCSGSCDNTAVVTINGHPYTITIH
jgi:hypothetical protein